MSDRSRESETRCVRAATFALVCGLLILQACADAPAPVTAWKALDTTAVSVDVAMRASADFWRAGRISDAQRDEIIKVFDVYRLAAQTAAAVIKAWAAIDPNTRIVPPAVADALRAMNLKAADVITTTKLYGVNP